MNWYLLKLGKGTWKVIIFSHFLCKFKTFHDSKKKKVELVFGIDCNLPKEIL